MFWCRDMAGDFIPESELKLQGIQKYYNSFTKRGRFNVSDFALLHNSRFTLQILFISVISNTNKCKYLLDLKNFLVSNTCILSEQYVICWNFVWGFHINQSITNVYFSIYFQWVVTTYGTLFVAYLLFGRKGKKEEATSVAKKH